MPGVSEVAQTLLLYHARAVSARVFPWAALHGILLFNKFTPRLRRGSEGLGKALAWQVWLLSVFLPNGEQ